MQGPEDTAKVPAEVPEDSRVFTPVAGLILRGGNLKVSPVAGPIL